MALEAERDFLTGSELEDYLRADIKRQWPEAEHPIEVHWSVDNVLMRAG